MFLRDRKQSRIGIIALLLVLCIVSLPVWHSPSRAQVEQFSEEWRDHLHSKWSVAGNSSSQAEDNIDEVLHQLELTQDQADLSLPEAEVISVEEAEADEDLSRMLAEGQLVLNLTTDDWLPPAVLDPSVRYLSYLPHSGFANQRIELGHALVLAKILNRTLIVPPVTYGVAIPWAPTPHLQKTLEEAEASNENFEECRAQHSRGPQKVKCGRYYESRRGSWSWLIGPDSLPNLQPVIARDSVRTSWYETALGITPAETHKFTETDRRHHCFWDIPVPANWDKGSGLKFTEAVSTDSLREFDDYKLLELASLFGAGRVKLRKIENRLYRNQVSRALVYRQSGILQLARKEVLAEFDPKEKYNAVHLRIGDSIREFSDKTSINILSVFKKILKTGYDLNDEQIESLASANEASYPKTIDETSPKPKIGKRLRCKSNLYPPDSPLVKLNTPIYIATDQPRSNFLDPFHKTFPCRFFLDDFLQPNTSLDLIRQSVDPLGYKLGGMMIGHIEAAISASARTVEGTPGSTFSGYIKDALHKSYEQTQAA